MPNLPQRRLAGFCFEAKPPKLPEKLPRMDIAVFVGFAGAGPIDLPVAVEDPGEYLRIFGDDLPLAWESRGGSRVWAHLGSAVRTFFRNGGRRCWVIRVTDRKKAQTKAETTMFPLPGVLQSDGGSLRPAFAHARAPGSGFDEFRCATALTVRPIRVTAASSPEALVVQMRTDTEVQVGDLLRLRLLDQDRHFYVRVTAVRPITEAPISGRYLAFTISGQLVHCFDMVLPDEYGEIPCRVTWLRIPEHDGRPAESLSVNARLGRASSPPNDAASESLELRIVESSPPSTDLFLPEPGAVLRIEAEGDELWFRVNRLVQGTGDPGSSPERERMLTGRALRVCRDSLIHLPPSSQFVAEVLTFELRVTRGDQERARLTDLGFFWEHARCWNAAPNDQALFDQEDSPMRTALQKDLRHAALWQEASEHPASGTRFPLAGSGQSSVGFLPVLVESLAGESLPAAHSTADELTRDGLVDFHSGLFLDPELSRNLTETLLDEADFIRYERPVTRRLTGLHAALDIEEATLIAVPDAVHVRWERDAAPRIPQPQRSAPLPHPCWGWSEGRDGETKPPAGNGPRWDRFLECSLRVLEPPVWRSPAHPGSGGSFTLTWSQATPDLTFVLEESVRPDFSDAREVYRGSQPRRTFSGLRPGIYYYRVRAEAGSETSNWSAELAVPVAARHRYVVLPVEAPSADGPRVGFDDGTLFDVHRSLLRVCGARGDILAVLAFPKHYRAEECLRHVAQLRHAEAGAGSALGRSPAIREGEQNVLSFGAIYHPWIVARESDGEPRPLPPDGAAAGVMARRSLERGAWIAPANEVVRGAIGLHPILSEGRRLDLLLAQVNQISREPRGYLTLNADTLSVDGELRLINVRRLLILLRRAALRRGADYVFEPNSAALRRVVQHSFENLLNQLFVRGAFAGGTRAASYQVVTDDSINTAPSVEAGRFRVDLKVAPSVPLSFVTVRLVQTGDRGIATEIV